jgi:glycosyltransferase involved in cell wall biosynthesis
LGKKLSIVHFIAKLDAGGAEKTCLVLSKIFADQGHETAVCVFESGGALEKELASNVSLIHLNRKSKFNPFKIFELAWIAERFDIVHAHMGHTLRYAYMTQLVPFFGFKGKIIFHDQYGLIKRKKVDFLLENAVRRNPYLGARNELVEWAKQDMEKNPEACYFLRNMVEKEECPIGNRSTNKIVLVSNFRPEKNIELAIEVISVLVKKGNDKVKLDIYGQIVDREYYESVLSLVEKEDLEEQVSVINNQASIQKVLGQYHFAIHCSTTEANPLVIQEFIAEVTPFLVTDAGEFTSEVKNNFPEFFVPDFNINTWVSAVERMLASPVDTYAELLLSYFEDHMSPSNYYEECLKIYQETKSYS